jgi:hypothetical protein
LGVEGGEVVEAETAGEGERSAGEGTLRVLGYVLVYVACALMVRSVEEGVGGAPAVVVEAAGVAGLAVDGTIG